MKLTAPQERVLRRIVKTSGGGIYFESDRDRNVLFRLHEKGLVQGKKGNQSRAVHTTAIAKARIMGDRMGK